MSDKHLIRIGELSRRAGVSVRALRYYEEIGLLQPAARTESGYRLYDEGVLYLLTMIKRMKVLGLSLDAVSELQALHRNHEDCVPVRQRFLAMIEEQVRRIDEQVNELTALRNDLVSYAEQYRQRLNEACGQEECCQAGHSSSQIAPRKGAKHNAGQHNRPRSPHQVLVLRG